MAILSQGLRLKILAQSIEQASKEQKLDHLTSKLRSIVPDISKQYTVGFDPQEYQIYWEKKLRLMHAFQVQGIIRALDTIGGSNHTLVDIGDSSGNHSKYIRSLRPDVKRCISVNLDPVAVEKAKATGEDAILCRAEEVSKHLGSSASLYMSFEMLEHLTDPIRFLHDLAVGGDCDYFLMTVPYVRQSRIGLHELRGTATLHPMDAEGTHIFELSPEDWMLAAKFAGWRTIFHDVCRQYPKGSPLRMLSRYWRKTDFEGFAIFLMKKDLSSASQYKSW